MRTKSGFHQAYQALDADLVRHRRYTMKSSVKVLFAAALLTLTFVDGSLALIGEVPTIRAVALVRSSSSLPTFETYALIGDTPANTHQLILRSVNPKNGALVDNENVSLPLGAVDVIFSNQFRPSTLLVLMEDLTVLQYGVAFDAFGLPKLIGDTPTILGPFGNPAILGAGTALADAPGFLAVGTTGGNLIEIESEDVSIETIELGKGAITSLGAVAQVGYFAFVAAHNGRAIGVNPNTSSVVFDLADPRPDPVIDLSTAAVFEPNDEPLRDAAPQLLVTANSTRLVTVLEIPANPTLGGTLRAGLIVVGQCPVAQVSRGSLAMLQSDGTLLYDPGFTPESGSSGVTFTIAGSSLNLDPDTLNLRSSGNYITATIEGENGSSSAIDVATLALRYDAASVSASSSQVGDSDADGQADLVAKFDRSAVEAMLAGVPEGPVTLQASWTFNDGSTGTATGVIRIKR